MLLFSPVFRAFVTHNYNRSPLQKARIIILSHLKPCYTTHYTTGRKPGRIYGQEQGDTPRKECRKENPIQNESRKKERKEAPTVRKIHI